MNRPLRKRHALRTLRDWFLIGLITLVLFEITLRCLQNYSATIRTAVAPPNLSFWEEYFVNNYEDGEFIYHGLITPHPTLGWITKPNQSIVVDDLRYTTNQQGMRSSHDYRQEPDKYNVLIVGDSFTFGDEADDSFVYLMAPEEIWSASRVFEEQNFCSWFMRRMEANFLNTSDYFLSDHNYHIQDGHYQKEEAGVVCESVYQKILRLPSWKKKCKDKQDGS